MFGDIEQKFIDEYKEQKEISENICHSTSGRKGMRYIDRVLTHLQGTVYVMKYRVRSKEAGSLIFNTFSEAAEKYNKL